MSKILIGDCIESMRGLPEKSVNCCVTSPPYFGLRSYDESAVRIDPALGGEKLSWLLEELRKRDIHAE